MKVLYDHQIFSLQTYGGISRYFTELIKGFDNEVSVIFNRNAYLKKGIKINFNFKGKSYLLNQINKPYSLFKIKHSKYDIFHPTYYDIYFLPFNRPFVITAHDLIQLKFKEFFLSSKSIEKLRILSKSANRIIAVSYATKNDLIRLLGVDEKKIDVVYHGSNFHLIKKDEDFKKQLPKRYILYIGERKGYKNFDRFYAAIKEFLSEDLFLVCVGGGKIEGEFVLHFNVNDSQLKTIYENALFFVFPSLEEGFGIPLLEAMACETPVLCSDISVFREIMKDNAIFFDPYDVSDIKEKVDFALKNDLSKFKKKLSLLYKNFSWDKTRRETEKVYLKALS